MYSILRSYLCNYPTRLGREKEAQRSVACTYYANERRPKSERQFLTESIQGNCKQLSGSVRHEWGKLASNDVEQVRGVQGFVEQRQRLRSVERYATSVYCVDIPSMLHLLWQLLFVQL